MAAKTYDPNAYDVIFAGILLNEGLAEDTFLTVVPDSAAFAKRAGVDGEVTRSRMANRMATATITLAQTSELNDRLSALHEADRDSSNGSGVASFEVVDRAGTTVGYATKAWIEQTPDMELAAEVSDREWTIGLADWRPTHGSNPDD